MREYLLRAFFPEKIRTVFHSDDIFSLLLPDIEGQVDLSDGVCCLGHRDLGRSEPDLLFFIILEDQHDIE